MNDTNIFISIITGILTVGGTLAVVCVGWGRMKQFGVDLKDNLGEFKTDIKNNILFLQKDVKEHDRDIAFLKGRKYADASSPLELNPSGRKVLQESGMDKIIDEKEQELIQKIKDNHPATFYDVQELAKEALETLKGDPNTLIKLKRGAYQSGVDIDILIFIGAIYLRNKFSKDGLNK